MLRWLISAAPTFRLAHQCLYSRGFSSNPSTSLSELRQQLTKVEAHLAMPSGMLGDALKDKAALSDYLERQRQRRLANRKAFLEWQAGQREKSAAKRLVRRASTAERQKRMHANTAGQRLIQTTYYNTATGDNTNNNINSFEVERMRLRRDDPFAAQIMGYNPDGY